eukprot:7313016-Prymnesium_polylepis.1
MVEYGHIPPRRQLFHILAVSSPQNRTLPGNDGVFTKASCVSNAKAMAPAVWWGQYGKHLPPIASVARRVLAQPVCASAAERNLVGLRPDQDGGA